MVFLEFARVGVHSENQGGMFRLNPSLLLGGKPKFQARFHTQRVAWPPLPIDSAATNEIQLIIPDLSSTPVIEDGYEPTEHHTIIRACRECFPGSCSFHFFPLNPRPDDVERIAAAANRQSPCIVFLSDALGNRGQQNLIVKIRERCRQPIFVLLDNPFDYTLIAPGETCLTAYGMRKAQLLALVQVICGKAPAPGKLPFRIQP